MSTFFSAIQTFGCGNISVGDFVHRVQQIRRIGAERPTKQSVCLLHNSFRNQNLTVPERFATPPWPDGLRRSFLARPNCCGDLVNKI